MDNLKIESFQAGQEFGISQFIKKVYDEFVSIDYTEEGNKFFYDWIRPSIISERQKNQNSLLVAYLDSILVGMIEIRDNQNISLLFVDKEFHGRGIAKRLFHKSLDICRERDTNLNKFYVHASPYSIPIYMKLGFKKTDEMQVMFGIKYLPMEMIIN